MEELLKPELVISNFECASAREVFESAYQFLYQNGYVKEGYLEAILKREDEHPTAIPLLDVAIAIPHVDPVYVQKSCILIYSLKNDVIFNSMLDRKETPVSYVFFLVLENGKKHIKALSELMKAMQDSDIVNKLKADKEAQDIFKLFAPILNQ